MKKIIVFALLALILAGCKPKETSSPGLQTIPVVPKNCIEAQAGQSERYEQNKAYRCGDSVIGLTTMAKEEYAKGEMDSFLNVTENYAPKEGETILEKETEECKNRKYVYILTKTNDTEKSALFLQEGRLIVTIVGKAKDIAKEMKLLCN